MQNIGIQDLSLFILTITKILKLRIHAILTHVIFLKLVNIVKQTMFCNQIKKISIAINLLYKYIVKY